MEKRGIPFIILSDHGFVKTKQEVYLAQYLKAWGYLSMENEKAEDLESMTGKTKIFALDPSRLYLHLEGKYKRGCVKKEEYYRLREEIKTKFLELEIDGEKVIKEILYKEEIYYGTYFDNAPDLVLVSHSGFDLKAGITKSTFYGRTLLEGMHARDNAVLIDACGLRLARHPGIDEIGKKLLEYFTAPL
jgi:predicted AlkP superfamily phosphohydrolase/phosphomutase